MPVVFHTPGPVVESTRHSVNPHVFSTRIIHEASTAAHPGMSTSLGAEASASAPRYLRQTRLSSLRPGPLKSGCPDVFPKERS